MNIATFLTATNVRAKPSRSAAILKTAQRDDVGAVLGDKVSGDNLTWYQIQHLDDVVGYSAYSDGQNQLYEVTQTPQAFDDALTFTLRWEGGYSNYIDDPGLETHYGISKAAHPHLDIKNLTLDHAKLIYYLEYWKPYNWNEYAWPKPAILFDIAVMTGPGHANGLRAKTTLEVLSAEFRYLIGLNGFGTFGRGWVRRTVELLEMVK